jgi:enoyl-CoA hydratase
MDLKTLLYEEKEGIAIVTINRPDKLNALNRTVIEELRIVMEDIDKNGNIRVSILTGAGDKAFVAGADVNEFLDLNPVNTPYFARKGQILLNYMDNMGKPIIAAVNGFALGGGCELAMACTLRILSDNAKLGLPELGLGVIPGYAGTQRLPRLIGKGRALWYMLTGDYIDAEEALKIGLANKVVPQKELMNTCIGIAKKIMTKSPLSIKLAIQAINFGLDTSLDQGAMFEATQLATIMASEDKKEGVSAFLEKRKPSFKGC